MLVQRHSNNLISVYSESGEDVGEIFRLPEITEIIRYNEDGITYTYIRVTLNPVISPIYNVDFGRVTHRKCHIWFVKQEYKGKVSIACGELPIPISEDFYSIDQQTYKFWLN